ncbi:MAG: 30S ribosomal protein S1 [Pseudomonadota bacterium]
MNQAVAKINNDSTSDEQPDTNQPEFTLDTGEDFEQLLSEFDNKSSQEGTIVEGMIIRIEKSFAYIDIGHKREGVVPIEEFMVGEEATEVKVGDVVSVYLSKIENSQGRLILSRVEAVKQQRIKDLAESVESKKPVEGIIFSRVKGGFTVDLNGVVAFLPGSQVDIRPIKDINTIMNVNQAFRVLKVDTNQGNIVVSRRAILEESRAEEREKLLAEIKEGNVMTGMVKNITEYGVFVDLGAFDGLLHLTDISWKKVSHPSEVLKIGDEIKVKIIKFNPENKRVSLGMKQLEENPWAGIDQKFTRGSKVYGKITNITDYGLFVQLDDDLEGLVHVSEISWIKNDTNPRHVFNLGQDVECVVLEVDTEKHRISLGMKQCADNPWSKFAEAHPVGTVLEGKIRNKVDFGVFVGFEAGIDGLAHVSDLSWGDDNADVLKALKVGESLKVQVLSVDIDKERISLGIKQLTNNPFDNDDVKKLNKNDNVTCNVTAVLDDGIEVEVTPGLKTFIRRSELSRERVEQRANRFAVGDRIDAKITAFDAKSNKIDVSIKALENEEHKKAIAEYGSSDSGASLGNILGAALDQARDKVEASENKANKDDGKKA